ncbi:MAG TPA: NAD-dependent epimerase/dehydratase family protein [Candidatus Eisenbacteria bacterium]|nr:NAD-dependent epimerase/dehydratase family protein [Candidatus Eisenbacteria bacterium]
MPATVLVTGASGFVGSHVVDALLARGYAVRCLVRSESSLDWLPGDRVQFCRGSMTDSASLEEAVRGVDAIVHSAGRVRAEGEQGYEDVNVEGTRKLVEAVEKNSPNLKRFVLVSSLAAGGPSKPGHLRSEDDPDTPISAYGRSKKRGEEEVERLGKAIPWTILRPCAVYGPRDRGFMVLARLAARGFSFRLGGAAQPVQVIHVRDLVQATLLSMDHPQAVGRRYYIANPAITHWDEVGRLMARLLGKSPRTLAMPRWAIPVVGRTVALGSLALRRQNTLPADRLRDLLAPAWTSSNERARTELGFHAETALEPGLAETMTWYRRVGWL